jgi:hypothetical protein
MDHMQTGNFPFSQNGVNSTCIDQAAFVKSVIQKQPSLASNPCESIQLTYIQTKQVYDKTRL